MKAASHIVAKISISCSSAIKTFVVFACLAGWDIFLQYNHSGSDALHPKWMIAAYIMLESILYGAAFAGLHLMVGRYIRCLYVSVFVLAVTFELIETFINSLFSMTIKGEWIILLMTSSRSEIFDFIKGTVLSSACTFAFIAITAVVVCYCVLKWWWRVDGSEKRSSDYCGRGFAALRMVTGVVLMVLLPIAHWSFAKSGHKCIFASIVQDTISTYNRQACLRVCLDPILPDGVKLADKGKKLAGVLVIGESATRNRWGLYGYKNNTTPMVASLKHEKGALIVFDDVKAAGFTTYDAIVRMFTSATSENPININPPMAAIVKKAGYYTSLISAQGHWNTLDCYEDILFHACDKRLFLGDVENLSPGYDERIMPFLRKELKSNEEKSKFLFVHFMGSHYPYQIRYPKGSFGRSDWDDYDNTILQTDGHLRQVVELLKLHDGPAFMIYVSDHGETPDSSTWRNRADKDCLEIPMVVWLSEEYVNEFTETVEKLKRYSAMKWNAEHIMGVFFDVARIEL